jgi:AhpD family alkylhydroperoxidase
MKQRISKGAIPDGYKALLGLENYLNQSSLDKKLLDLVRLRVSQINGCAFCIDMHWKDLRADGEGEQRLYGLDSWEESPYYDERERAALAWSEAVTRIHPDRVPDAVYDRARAVFEERQLADLTLAVVAINGWNRLNIAFRTPAGGYEVRRHAETAPRKG